LILTTGQCSSLERRQKPKTKPKTQKTKPHTPEELKLQNLISDQIKSHKTKSVESQITFSTNY